MAEARAKRRLAAILAADVVGYSRLMEHDEAGTLTALKARRREVLAPLVAQHHGRLVKVMGDGVLVEFASAVDAVECAVEVQKRFAETNRSLPEACRIVLRIGINLGDVIVEGSDLYGDGVNVAARLENLAEPGSICVSGSVYDQVKRKLASGFDDLGAQAIKNIAEPVHVYRVREERDEPEQKPLPLPDRPSIAVLPFDNLSGQPEETYFSDGITEDIITGLARFRSLFVIARNSSFAFRGKPIDIAEIGRKLGVSYLLEGSVRRAGDRVRITAQLIEAATGAHLWAERYDRSLDDIFAVQDEVAQMIVAALFGRIQEAGVSDRTDTDRQPYGIRLSAAWPRSLQDLRRGRQPASLRDVREGDRARSALRLGAFVSRFGAGHDAWFCHCACRGSGRGVHGGKTRGRTRPTGKPLPPNTIDNLPLPTRIRHGRAPCSRRAFDLNPNDADAMVTKGRLLALRGRPEEALDWVDAAVRLNPLHPPWYYNQFGIALYSLRRFAEAAQALKRFPSRAHGCLRGSRPAMPSSKGAQRHSKPWRRSYDCGLISRRPSICAKACSLNAAKTGSFSAKDCSRQDSLNEFCLGGLVYFAVGRTAAVGPRLPIRDVSSYGASGKFERYYSWPIQ